MRPVSPSDSVSARSPLAACAVIALVALFAHPLLAGAAEPVILPASAVEALSPNARWASGVVAFSSQYGSTDWSAAQATGYPNTEFYGDHKTAWASLTGDGQREFIELSFSNPSPANYLVAVETLNPGAIDSVYTWNPNTSHYDLVWSGTASPGPLEVRLWTVTFPTTAYPVSRVRLALNSPAVHSWSEIDAVAVGANAVSNQEWASSAVASSQYQATNYAPIQATGPPDVYPDYGDIFRAWASLTADGSREWLQLTYAVPETTARVRVYQTFHPGAIDSIYVRDALDGSLHLVYSAVPAAQPGVATILDAEFQRTLFPVDAVRLTLASNVVTNWNEIDAVAIADSIELYLPGITAVGPSADHEGIEAASPNPFRTGSTIRFSISREGPARLQVFDVCGARVATLATGTFAAGPHTLTWNGVDDSGRRVAAGLYFVEFEAAGLRDTRRLIRLR